MASFATDRGTARRAYARFVAEGVNQPRPETKQQPYLGGEDFAARMAKRTTRVPSEVPRQQCAHKSLAQYERETSSRNAAIEAAYASGTYTLKAIGEHFGLLRSVGSPDAGCNKKRPDPITPIPIASA